jgi:hypothetical protein
VIAGFAEPLSSRVRPNATSAGIYREMKRHYAALEETALRRTLG